MTIFDDIRKDREAGTPGEWLMGYHGDVYTGEIRCALDSDYDGAIADWVGIFDARRIARVPRLERIALAAEELAKRAQAVFISEYVNTKHIDAAKDYYDSNMNALAAFRAACGEGEE